MKKNYKSHDFLAKASHYQLSFSKHNHRKAVRVISLIFIYSTKTVQMNETLGYTSIHKYLSNISGTTLGKFLIDGLCTSGAVGCSEYGHF